MAYQCTRCGRIWDDEAAHEMEMLCTRKCGGTLAVDSSAVRESPLGFAEHLAQLPSIIAIPLKAFVEEYHPIVRLHRLCDVAELLTRFATIVALGELRADGQPLAKEVADALQPQIERPTFGHWRNMLGVLTDCLASRSGLVVPDLVTFVSEQLLPALDDRRCQSSRQGLIGLRNDLVHGGATPLAWAQERIDMWDPWFFELGERIMFLARVEVALVCDAVAKRLLGAQSQAIEQPLSEHQQARLESLNGHVVLMCNDRVLDLWPLCDYGRAIEASSHGPRIAATESPMIFVRAKPDRLLYAALGVELPQGERTDVLADFKAMFQLSSRVAPINDQRSDFEAEVREDAASLTGRKAELQQVKQVVKATQSGILWIYGPPGIGKSFLAARLAADLRGDPRKVCRIFWRFNFGDDARCSRSAFLRHAVACLRSWLDISRTDTIRGENDEFFELREVLDKVGKLEPPVPGARPPRVLIILDGLDVIAKVDEEFGELPFQLARPNVVWLCVGRFEGELLRTFSEERCTHVFQAGLPGMGADDIRAMLIDGTGSLKYELLKLECEDESGDGNSEVNNAAVDAVVECSQGLPLYVHFVVEDIQAGDLRFAELPHRCPPGLNAYYDVMLRRLAVGDLHAILTPLMVTIAWAESPLDEELLLYLLARRKVLSKTRNGRELLQQGLRTIQSMVRLAPVAGGDRLGYEPYHFTLRDHIRSDSTGIVREQNQITKDELCAMVKRWHLFSKLHSARPYGLLCGPRTLRACGRVKELETLLLDHRFLEAKVEAGYAVELSEDLAEALSVLPRGESGGKFIELILEALRRDLHFILRHPSALFQCLWNTCWWYDCPAAATHYSEPECGKAGTVPWKAPQPRLHTFMEGWRAAKEALTPGFHWIRSLRPPALHLGSPLTMIIGDHGSLVTDVAYSPDGRRIASASWEGPVKVWDATSGRELVEIEFVAPLYDIERGYGIDLMPFSSDGRRILCIVNQQLAGVWDADNGQELSQSATDEAYAALVVDEFLARNVRIQGERIEARSVDGRFLVCGDGEGMVSLHDAINNTEVFRCAGHECSVTCVAFSPRADYFVTGSEDNSLRIWRTDRPMQFAFRDKDLHATCVAVSPDREELFLGATDGIIRVFERETGREIRRFQAHDASINSMEYCPKGTRILTGSSDGTARVWDPESGTELLRVDCDCEVDEAWYTPPDDRWIVTDGDLWDATTGEYVETIGPIGSRYARDSSYFRSCGPLEFAIVSPTTGEAVAWFPAQFHDSSVHDTGGAWVGRVGSHSHVLVVEGDVAFDFQSQSGAQ